MWLFPHNHRSRIHNLLPCGIAALCSLFAVGCTSLPRFSVSRDVAGPAAVPRPVFDDGERVQIAARGRIRKLVQAPGPFVWTPVGQSAGGRDIDGATIGAGGYRIVIVGSIAGHDPIAVTLADRLARHVHRNQIILGGVEVTAIRNLNPDGESLRQMENDDGAYLNHHFGRGSTRPTGAERPPEVQCLLSILDDKMPQRVIHLRTIARDTGLVAASKGSAEAAGDVAEWLQLRQVTLPGKASQGTLEHFLSTQETCEVVTVALPADTDANSAWEEYGDALLNLLLADDYETRKMARTRRTPTAADRRGRKDGLQAPDLRDR